jgi:twinkle protein
MATLAEKLLEHGIRPRSFAPGNYKMLCPKCSHTRKNRTDPCLSLTIEDDERAVWDCKNECGFRGAIMPNREPTRSRMRAPAARPARPPDELTSEVMAWLRARGIDEAVARRNKIGAARVYFPQISSEAPAVAFPYFRNGELINVKFRALGSKAFTQVKGAEAIAYGLDDLADSRTVIIVEGECDKLAVEQAGYRNAISVPNGAQTGGKTDDDAVAFAWLAEASGHLDQANRIILAGDADERGRALETELSRRLGRERCWRVRWPDSEDSPCKDANETLMRHGAGVVCECIEGAKPYPIVGLHDVAEYVDETISLYRDGRARAHSTGWASIDEFMTIRPGELSVVTGIPNSGKSEFIDALAVNLAHRSGWRFALCSFENSPAEHIAKLAEKHTGLPFWDGPRPRMTEADLVAAMGWASDHFHLIRFDDEPPTIDGILDKACAAVMRHGVRGLVIDPYNEIEHQRAANVSETEYVSQTLGKVKRFAQVRDVHVWFVAHPAKMQRDGNKALPPPTLYDISGSANWANKADVGVVVHRDPANDPTRTDIYVRKVRFKSVGKIGVASLRYDRTTGRYSELTSAPTYSAAKGHRDD